jgi:hypothetical protein
VPEGSSVKIPPDLVIKVREWLGYDGCAWFSMLKEVTGTVSPVLTRPGNVQHSVNMNVGLKVRNFMQKSGLCANWTPEDLENTWAQVVGLAIYA